MNFVLICCTNRPQAMARKVTGFVQKQLEGLLGKTDQLQILDLKDLPPEIFSPESYAQKPASFEPFIQTMVKAQAQFLVTPEYNGGMPGVLKYFIDMLPFPESLQRRPTTVVGVADGRFGALRPVEHLEDILRYRNAFLFPERTFIPFISKAIDENGKPKDEGTLKVLNAQIENFVKFARRFENPA